MSEYTAFLKWQYGCRDRGGYGVGSADTFYQGMRNYDQPYPCPNGLAIDTRTHEETPAWQRRLAKAKRDIEQHRREYEIKALSKSLTVEEVTQFIQEIRTWARSLRMQSQSTKQATG